MKTIGAIVCFTAALFAVSCPVSAEADVLELKSGQKIEGEFAGGSKEEVHFQVGSETLKFKIVEVFKISIGTSPREDFHRAAKEALRELKALASIVEAGVSYRDYSPRVLDAKVKVDQFLDGYKASPLLIFNEHVADSLGFYIAASTVWNAKISGNISVGKSQFDELVVNPYIQRCLSLEEQIRAEKQRSFLLRRDRNQILKDDISAGIPYLWICAHSSLNEAEKALGQ